MLSKNNEILNKPQRAFLILIGGAEDKRNKKTVLRKVVETTQASNIIIIPSASFYPRDIAFNYIEAFNSLGVEKVDYFDIRYPKEADTESFFKKINEADLLYFSGGDQVKLVNTFEGTQLLEKIKTRFLAGELSIAGTSAGAAAASNPMTYDGDYNGFIKGSVHYSKGFGFLDDITVDTHFISRGRIARLTQFLLTGLSKKGIGLGEDTGIVISSDNTFEVVGSGMVTLINSEEITHSNFKEIEDGSFYAVNNLKIGFLTAGMKFNLDKWLVEK